MKPFSYAHSESLSIKPIFTKMSSSLLALMNQDSTNGKHTLAEMKTLRPLENISVLPPEIRNIIYAHVILVTLRRPQAAGRIQNRYSEPGGHET